MSVGKTLLNAKLVERIDITDNLSIFKVLPDSGVPNFTPGQYVALGLYGSAPRKEGLPLEDTPPPAEKIIKRAYSIGSSPEDKNSLEFYIAIVPDGALTSRIALLNPGERLYIAPRITGTFTLNEAPEGSNLVFVATGTGIAPYISMLRYPATWEKFNNITLIHGVRFSSDFAYSEELQFLEKSSKIFHYYPIVSRDSKGWTGKRGYVQSLLQDGTIKLNPLQDHLFVCGNPAMIQDLEELLTANGYKTHKRREPGNLHIEKYW